MADELDRVLDELFASECQHELSDELPCRECTRTAIAAAEERGRRRGVEEAAKCVRRMAGRDWDSGYEEPLLDAVKQIRALAPRDSGKEG